MVSPLRYIQVVYFGRWTAPTTRASAMWPASASSAVVGFWPSSGASAKPALGRRALSALAAPLDAIRNAATTPPRVGPVQRLAAITATAPVSDSCRLIAPQSDVCRWRGWLGHAVHPFFRRV